MMSFGILRFLLGISEAGNWPGEVKAVAENFAPEQRAFAVGVFNNGSTAGAIIAPPLVATIVGFWGSGWNSFGCLGSTRIFAGDSAEDCDGDWSASYTFRDPGISSAN
jgi:MFS family permease